MATRDELVVPVAARYASGTRTERARILDEFTAVTGHHRKHATRLLRVGLTSHPHGPRQERRIYDEAVRQALVVIWEASARICGKRLRPLIPVLVEARERHDHHLRPRSGAASRCGPSTAGTIRRPDSWKRTWWCIAAGR